MGVLDLHFFQDIFHWGKLTMVTWAYPWVGLIIFIYPGFLALYLWQQRQKSFFTVGSIDSLKAGFAPFKSHLKLRLVLWHILVFLSAAFFVLALMRPQIADSRVKRTVDGLDIVIVLDVSDSMLIEDMKPFNRLESAKQTIADFVQKRSSDRIGLVIFAGEAFTLVPPTLDYQLLLQRVSEIQTANAAHIRDGTAIGVAMASGAARLKDSQAKSRIMIFLTDGENNSGTIDPEAGLEIAKGYGIKIYSVGIGKSGKTQLPIYGTDAFGNKIKRYQAFESYVNDELLQQMAQVTGGKYFRASKEDSLQGIFSEINKLETTKVEDLKFVRYQEYFVFFAFWGLFFYCLQWLLQLTLLRRGPI